MRTTTRASEGGAGAMVADCGQFCGSEGFFWEEGPGKTGSAPHRVKGPQLEKPSFWCRAVVLWSVGSGSGSSTERCAPRGRMQFGASWRSGLAVLV